mmetsp:Transcript_5830/g.17403  ORF Transcript_5830/g.17403 Transcript_5830/m.17403 type:complete len:255 (+) Transcript_5830:1362-2126(+)
MRFAAFRMWNFSERRNMIRNFAFLTCRGEMKSAKSYAFFERILTSSDSRACREVEMSSGVSCTTSMTDPSTSRLIFCRSLSVSCLRSLIICSSPSVISPAVAFLAATLGRLFFWAAEPQLSELSVEKADSDVFCASSLPLYDSTAGKAQMLASLGVLSMLSLPAPFGLLLSPFSPLSLLVLPPLSPLSLLVLPVSPLSLLVVFPLPPLLLPLLLFSDESLVLPPPPQPLLLLPLLLLVPVVMLAGRGAAVSKPL